ncbi:hypothetical protein CO661_14205 [Sinorhizobium fredii]|uniref:Uncharacterized protein n=1 Tax=Rhizobium fredii TaxID=380 RepID=A0A2A6LXR2_RHIFR|nr:hypothetical protein [Sinorhizobium fredii]PDT47331.1 hypothetical protein CO661_14205 [Sinorhizobium fredii]
MSVQGTYVGNVYPPISQTLAGTSVTLIDAAMPDNTFTLASFVICNATAGAVVTELYWYEASTTTQRLIWQKSVAANDTVIVSDMPLRLLRSDEIRVKGAADVRVTLIFIKTIPLT